MQITTYPVRPSFGIRIYNNNNALTEITEVAAKRGIMPILDATLNNLLHIEGGNMIITHGVHEPSGIIYSNFRIGKNTVANMVKDCKTPADASLDALFELLDRNNPKLMALLGKRVTRFVSAEDIIRRYSA